MTILNLTERHTKDPVTVFVRHIVMLKVSAEGTDVELSTGQSINVLEDMCEIRRRIFG
jgi:hypothetical protein